MDDGRCWWWGLFKKDAPAISAALSLLLSWLVCQDNRIEKTLVRSSWPISNHSTRTVIMAGGFFTFGIPLVLHALLPLTGAGVVPFGSVGARPGSNGCGGAAAVDTPDVPPGPSAGCSIPNAPPLDTTLNITIGDRRYLLYFPVNYEPSTPAPLILSYHGGTRTAERQQALDLLTTTYFNQDYIVVYPNGLNVCR